MKPEFWETVSRRQSIRRYEDRPVPLAEIERIVSVASSAPSAHNSQPWHFAVVTSRQTRDALVRAMAAAYDADMTKAGVPPQARKSRIDRSLDLIGSAPVIIVPYLVPDGTGQEEHTMAVQSVAAATGYLLLASTACGLGACWYSAPLFCPAILNQHLQMKEGWEPQALITLGYPAESPDSRQKKPLQDVMSHV